jgi:hypothetical protein
MADLAAKAVFLSGYGQHRDTTAPAYLDLDRALDLDTERPPLHEYARLLDLYKDICATAAERTKKRSRRWAAP